MSTVTGVEACGACSCNAVNHLPTLSEHCIAKSKSITSTRGPNQKLCPINVLYLGYLPTEIDRNLSILITLSLRLRHIQISVVLIIYLLKTLSYQIKLLCKWEQFIRITTRVQIGRLPALRSYEPNQPSIVVIGCRPHSTARLRFEWTSERKRLT